MCEKFRENDFQQPECMIIALNLVNPSIEEIGPYAVKIDFKSVTSRPLTKKDMVEVSGSGNFVSSDLSIKATTEYCYQTIQ